MTADQDLSARLAELHGRRLESAHAYSAAISAIVEAYRSGQLITLADHLAAVQAAVAKAVEAEREACADAAECVPGTIAGHIIWPPSKSAIAAAIRSRALAAPVTPANEGGV